MWFMTCTIMHNIEEELDERVQMKLRIEADAGASQFYPLPEISGILLNLSIYEH